MTTKLLHRMRIVLPCSIAGLLLVVLLPGSVRPAAAQTVAVMVNGEPITDYDIEQRSKLDQLSTHKQTSRQDVITELINDHLKIKEAKKFGVDPGVSDVNGAYREMSDRMHISPDQLSASLEKSGIRPDTLKFRIKSDMVWGSLVRGRYKERLEVGEKEVNDAVKAAGGDATAQSDAFEYRMQPVVLIVPRGSPQSAFDLRQKDAETLRSRIETCDQANQYFKSMPNSAIRDPVIRTSADIPANLRKILDDTPIGHLTPPEVTKDGISMVALCSRKPTTIDTPQKKEMRDKLYQQKYQTTSNNYLEEIRKEAMIEYRQVSAEDSKAEDRSASKRRRN